tara:strand:- start:54 stop:242 length:189 start_codon:yes stop_codon:yes gene_type:complete
MATSYKYRQYISGTNDSVDITFDADGDGNVIVRNVPMNSENGDYKQILAGVAASEITIADAD